MRAPLANGIWQALDRRRPTQGHNTKMSASAEHTAIFMTDTPNQIKNKVRALAAGWSRTTPRARLGCRQGVGGG